MPLRRTAKTVSGTLFSGFQTPFWQCLLPRFRVENPQDGIASLVNERRIRAVIDPEIENAGTDKPSVGQLLVIVHQVGNGPVMVRGVDSFFPQPFCDLKQPQRVFYQKRVSPDNSTLRTVRVP